MQTKIIIITRKDKQKIHIKCKVINIISKDKTWLIISYYEGRPINKLQNGIILLIFKI